MSKPSYRVLRLSFPQLSRRRSDRVSRHGKHDSGTQAADRVRDVAALARHCHAHVSGGVCPGNRAQGPDERGQGSGAHGEPNN